MTDKTYDTENSVALPYRFCPSPLTGEVFIIGRGMGLAIIAYFENYPSFHRFLVEGNKTDDLIQGDILKEAADILRDKQIRLNGGT